jgi:hypothetical protein
VAGDVDGCGGPALCDVCRRVQAHGLVQGRSRQLGGAAAVGGHLLLDGGVVAEQVQREGERSRGGFMPGEHEDQYLVADLRRGQAPAGVGVAGGEQSADEVVGVLGGRLGAAPGEDAVDDRVLRGAQADQAAITRRRYRERHPHHLEGAAQGDVADQRYQLGQVGDDVVDVRAEQRPSDDT